MSASTSSSSSSIYPSFNHPSVRIADVHIVRGVYQQQRKDWWRIDVTPFVLCELVLFILALPRYAMVAEEEQLSDITDEDGSGSMNDSAQSNSSSSTSSMSINSTTALVNASLSSANVFSLESLSAMEIASLLSSFIFPIFLIVHGIVFLMAYWNVSVRAFLRFHRLKDNSHPSAGWSGRKAAAVVSASSPTFIRLHPAPHCGSSAIVPVQSLPDSEDPTRIVFYFVFQSIKYVMHRKEKNAAAIPLSDSDSSSQASAPEDVSPSSSSSLSASSSTATALPSGEQFYWAPVEQPTHHKISTYYSWSGFRSNNEISAAIQKYGKNIFDIPLPSFMDLYLEHIMAPFFVFQIFCVTLWLLDEYWQYSLMTLIMLVVFEGFTVQRRLKHFADLREIRTPPYPIQVYRLGKWSTVSSDELLPGDIVVLKRGEKEKENQVVAADVLLLSGSAVVNESMLTGESVPQLKECLVDYDPTAMTQQLDFKGDHKRCVIFAGTRLLLTHPAKSQHPTIKPPSENTPLGYVIRTGFHTSQGQLVRTMLFTTERVTVDNREALLFIGCLLLFAIFAAGYVLYHGLQDPNRPRYKLLLNCIMIVTSVVPPELPMELSLAVNMSLIKLVKQAIYCTEPFRLPLCGQIEICCFDKTGTLTSDTFAVRGIAKGTAAQKNANAQTPPATSASTRGTSTYSSSSSSNSAASLLLDDDYHLSQLSELSDEMKYVLVGCHSLVEIDNELVGDPLEKASFKWAGFAYQKGDVAVGNLSNTNNSGTPSSSSSSATSSTSSSIAASQTGKVRILHRFPFSSALKRMSTVVHCDHLPNSNLRVVAKGASEVMRARFASVPDNYDECAAHFARQGCRVLALGHRVLPYADDHDGRNAVRKLHRDDVEKDMTFGGFLILQSPLKDSSVETIKHLMDSSHHVLIITGDHVLTATHVAKQLGITTTQTLILQKKSAATTVSGTNDYGLIWRSVDESLEVPFELSAKSFSLLNSAFDLSATGDAIDVLTHARVPLSELSALFVQCVVFARTSPDQKELILRCLKHLGHWTLMCGDGTNDVGALKQAHVGVALLGDEVRAKKEREAMAVRHDFVQLGNAAVVGGGAAAENVKFRSEAIGTNPLVAMNAMKAKVKAATDAAKKSGRPLTILQMREIQQKAMQDAAAPYLKQLEEEMKDTPLVRLGDASIASPFTSKWPFVSCVVDIIRQGRCTLVTTMQMFNILGVNCLMTAYALSVLYTQGVKLGDFQMLVSGLLIAMCFLFVSRSEPLETLSSERPHSRIFHPLTFLSVAGQFAIHMCVLINAVNEADIHVPHGHEDRKIDGKFRPNVLNSVVYLISTTTTVVTFVANYRGRPFMGGLNENKALRNTLALLYVLMIVLASESMPWLNEMFELISMPSEEFRSQLVFLILADLLATLIYVRLLRALFAIHPKTKLKKTATAESLAKIIRIHKSTVNGSLSKESEDK